MTASTLIAHMVAVPPFSAQVHAVTRADLPHSWRPGCPVAPGSLRRIDLRYIGFDGAPHVGSIVVNAVAVAAVTKAFRTLYVQRFPIRRMEPVDAFGGSDDRSMAADNTSGFNCRAAVASGPTSWSMHAYGLAVDVDPVENPYVFGGTVRPPRGRRYLDRANVRPGMAAAGDVLVRAFAAVGWSWGAAFGDYQHFSSNGR